MLVRVISSILFSIIATALLFGGFMLSDYYGYNHYYLPEHPIVEADSKQIQDELVAACIKTIENKGLTEELIKKYEINIEPFSETWYSKVSRSFSSSTALLGLGYSAYENSYSYDVVKEHISNIITAISANKATKVTVVTDSNWNILRADRENLVAKPFSEYSPIQWHLALLSFLLLTILFVLYLPE